MQDRYPLTLRGVKEARVTPNGILVAVFATDEDGCDISEQNLLATPEEAGDFFKKWLKRPFSPRHLTRIRDAKRRSEEKLRDM